MGARRCRDSFNADAAVDRHSPPEIRNPSNLFEFRYGAGEGKMQALGLFFDARLCCACRVRASSKLWQSEAGWESTGRGCRRAGKLVHFGLGFRERRMMRALDGSLPRRNTQSCQSLGIRDDREFGMYGMHGVRGGESSLGGARSWMKGKKSMESRRCSRQVPERLQDRLAADKRQNRRGGRGASRGHTDVAGSG